MFFCNCGGQGWRWLPYKPLARNSTNNPCVYLVNKYGHFEPVLDVQEEIYTRTPYLKIGDYLNRRYHHFLSQEMLDSSLVNAASDEQKLRDFEDINPPHVYTKKFTDRYCTPCRFNVDPNIFNLLCDWSDFEMYLLGRDISQILPGFTIYSFRKPLKITILVVLFCILHLFFIKLS